MMHLGGHDDQASYWMQSDPYRNGTEYLAYGTVCDGVHAMTKECT